MSSISEDLHLRINALGSERILQLLDIEQTNRLRLTHAAERTLLYQTHKLALASSGTIESGIVTNHAPTIEPPEIPDLSNNQSQQSFTIGVNDPDPTDTHTFTFTSRPGTWVSISGNQLRINPNGRTAGTYNVGLRVTDNGSPQESDTGDVSFRILQANRDPVLASISNKSIRRHRTLRFSASATDADNDPITYSISNGAKSGMRIDSETGQFTWTPGAGQSGGTITIRASDGRGGTATRNVSITVTEPPAQSSPPTLDAIGPKSRTGTGRVSFRVRARDPNNLDISFSASGGSFGTATKQSDGKWTALYTSPNYSSAGVKYVTITATASGGSPANETDAETVTITVSANRPPVLQSIGNKTVRRGETLTFRARATDPEDDTITYTESGVGSINSSTGIFSYSPSSSTSLGNKTATITATATGGSDSETITITVEAASVTNATPVITAIPDQTKVNNEAAYNLSISYTDADAGDTHTLTKIAGPSWVTKVNNTTLRIAPNGRTPDTYNVSVRVRDNGTPQAEAVATFTITILQANRAPVLNAVSHGNIILGQQARVNLIATDADGDDITYVLVSGGGAIAGSVWTWTPTTTGAKTVKFKARDAHGAESATRTMTFTVNPVPVIPPTPPVITAISNQTVLEGDTLTLTARAADPNDLSITWTKRSGVGAITSAGAFSYNAPAVSSDTTYSVKLRATASGGSPANEYAEISFNITVKNNRPPVLQSIGNKSIRIPNTLTFTASATDPESNTITYSRSGVGSINSGTGKYTLNTASQTAGNKTVTITARTPDGQTDSETITITVLAALPSPPTLTPGAAFSTRDIPAADTGKTFYADFTATDPHNLPLTVTAANGTVSKRTGGYRVSYTTPAYGQSKTITVNVTARGGTPANETASASFTVTTLEPDYRPNITITAPLHGASVARISVGYILVLYMKISATRYNGEVIPLNDLTVTQNKVFAWPNHGVYGQLAGVSSPVYAGRPGWAYNAPNAGPLVLTVSYTDTINNRAYTRSASVTVNMT